MSFTFKNFKRAFLGDMKKWWSRHSIVVVPIAVVIVVADLVSKERGKMQKAKS
jgi:hypothetical protein